jgi:MOSC domain-containing protein YiiM
MSARVVSLNRSAGGVPKLPVEEARVTTQGMAGDRQRDLVHHGGPDRALSLYSLELIDQLQLEGHPISPGAVGENVTISGLDWSTLKPGTTLSLGDVEVEVTAYAVPCTTIRDAFLDREFVRISNKVHPGWSRVYVRVLREGTLHANDVVTIGRSDSPVSGSCTKGQCRLQERLLSSSASLLK